MQLRPEFGFYDAADVAEYLAALGVSHLYCSPYLQAASGSTHGYDVVDYGWVSAELGGASGHSHLDACLKEQGLGQILDIVPNHMATTPENAWWWDVLENGPSSRYADYFDIDWHAPESRLRNKVLLPILGSHYGRVLESGDIRMIRAGAVFQVTCPGHLLPVTPDSLNLMLALAAGVSGSDELESIAAALGRLPPGTSTDGEAVHERERDGAVLLGSLARLLDEHPEVAAAVDHTIGLVNGDPDTLDAILEAQNYRVAYWRVATGGDLPYRRFFDINTLVGLRMERQDVFEATHALVLGWTASGVLDGLRVDHIDGLRDPQGYLERLRAQAGGSLVEVEKILQPGEALRGTWPVAGTTGYDFLNRVNGLFVDSRAEGPLTDLYEEVSGTTDGFAEVEIKAKHEVMELVLASDVNRLTELLVQICEQHRRYRDYTRHELHEALREFFAVLPVYRTYVNAEAGHVTPEDRAVVGAATDAARRRRPDLDPDLFVFLYRVLALELTGSREADLVMRLQQISAAIMAKGAEDTAFYRYHRLVSLNEVGGSPGCFGGSVDDFHATNAAISRAWPATMTTLATHDTKRGPDVRARLNLLSEIPDQWREAVTGWMKANDRYRTGPWPDANIEYLMYQTLVGAHPLTEDRLLAYLQKASKEAKQYTSWTDPNPEYDAALAAFASAILGDQEFMADLAAFVAPLRVPGWINALGQSLLLLAAPGIPDIYQGTELWDFSLVDPDNRRPVDFAHRRALLSRLAHLSPEQLWAEVESGLPKLAVVRGALEQRRRYPEAFGPAGGYAPLYADGPDAHRVVAFCRGGAAVCVVPRLVTGLLPVAPMAGEISCAWGMAAGPAWETALGLPPGRWRDAFSGRAFTGPVALGDLWSALPVALLLREDG